MPVGALVMPKWSINDTSMSQRVVDLVVVRHALEHVLRGEFHVLRLGVHRLAPDEVVRLALLLARRRRPDHRVDDAPFARRVERGVAGGRERGHDDTGSRKTRCAFSRRNFGHTWSRNGTSGISVKMRS